MVEHQLVSVYNQKAPCTDHTHHSPLQKIQLPLLFLTLVAKVSTNGEVVSDVCWLSALYRFVDCRSFYLYCLNS